MPSLVRATLAGFRSRWMMPRSCAASSASAICRAIRSASSSESGPRARRLASVCPSTNSRIRRRHRAGLFQPVDRGNVRVIQRGQDLRLATEARLPVRVLRERLRQDFQGDVPLEPRIMGAVDLAHAAVTDGGDDSRRDQVECRCSAPSAASREGEVGRLLVTCAGPHPRATTARLASLARRGRRRPFRRDRWRRRSRRGQVECRCSAPSAASREGEDPGAEPQLMVGAGTLARRRYNPVSDDGSPMALSTGARLGAYEIVAAIGSGGMSARGPTAARCGARGGRANGGGAPFALNNDDTLAHRRRSPWR